MSNACAPDDAGSAQCLLVMVATWTMFASVESGRVRVNAVSVALMASLLAININEFLKAWTTPGRWPGREHASSNERSPEELWLRQYMTVSRQEARLAKHLATCGRKMWLR